MSWVLAGAVAAVGVISALAVAVGKWLRDRRRYDRPYRGWEL